MNRGLLIVLIAICAIVFGISAYKLIAYYSADRAAEKEFAELLPDFGEEDPAGDVPGVDWLSYETLLPYYEDLKKANDDFVGWLRIPDTRISYPVMQTLNSPEYYLDKDFKKQYSASGTLFAASICDVDMPSDVVTIYGHRMKTGAMFGSMGDFLEQDFFAEHEDVIFDTLSGRGEYKIYCLFSEAVGTGNEFAYYLYSVFPDEGFFDDFLGRMKGFMQIENPLYEPVYGDKVLFLSTCEYTHENGRLVMAAVRVEEGKRVLGIG